MKTITQNLQKELKSKLKSADEIWIAVALLTNKGLEFIQENLPSKAKQHYILGIDLPTDPIALDVLCKQQLLEDVTVKMFYNQEFYHPKAYITKSKDNYTAFVGSANCTRSGLFANIELSNIITSQSECLELISWFNAIESKSATLTTSFIKVYRESYQLRLDREKVEEKIVKNLKEKLEVEYEVTVKFRKALITTLKKCKAGSDYAQTKRIRKQNIIDIKNTIDYPNFKKIDVDAFFQIWELGHLIAIPKPTIKAEINRIKSLLLFLIDDSVDVAVRIDRALKGDLKIRGVGEALISKILTAHDPKMYFVKNN
ncbi:HKD family nuclease [Flavobacterium sp. PL11]|uniref:phospholipase D family protein n=1 Tax=Flavobacterium sp. PL11 TaxID=3071717 RepID=UPI002E015B88|nr:HKD family nuclease [Flavobacterium sp. PL11]